MPEHRAYQGPAGTAPAAGTILYVLDSPSGLRLPGSGNQRQQILLLNGARSQPQGIPADLVCHRLETFAPSKEEIFNLRSRAQVALREAFRLELLAGREDLADAYEWSFGSWVVAGGVGENAALCAAVDRIRPSKVVCLTQRLGVYTVLRALAREGGYDFRCPRVLRTRLTARHQGRRLLGKGRDILEWWRIARAKARRASVDSCGGAVLAFAWYHNHFNSLAPVVAALLRRGVAASLVLGVAFAARNGPSQHDVLPRVLLEARGSLRAPRSLRRHLGAAWFEAVLAQALAGSDSDAPHLEIRSLARDMAWRFADSLRHTERFFAAAQRIIQEQPRALLLPYQDSQYVHILGLLARKMNIPTIHLLQGLPSPNTNDRFVGAADFTLIWGEYSRRVFSANGGAPDRLVPLGSPMWDDYLQERLSTGGMSLARVNPLPQLTYLPTPASPLTISRERKAELMSWLRSVLLQFAGVRLLIKLHPLDARGSVEGRVVQTQDWRDLRDRVELVASGPVRPVLERSGLVFSPYSTAIFETLLVGKPLVYHPLWDDDRTLAQVLDGACYVARSQGDLLRAMDVYLTRGKEAISPSERVSAVLEDVFFRLDGKAAERCADFILSRSGARSPVKLV